jgi:transcriptional regulator with XRE-family HTH domain
MPTKPFELRDLEIIRRKLGMSRAILARRSGVSLPTVTRILSGKDTSAHYRNVLAIAVALGVDFRIDVDVEKVRERQARKKARRLVGDVQGTSALEGQAVDRKTYLEMVRRTCHELLAGPRRRLWGE